MERSVGKNWGHYFLNTVYMFESYFILQFYCNGFTFFWSAWNDQEYYTR